MRLSVKLLAPLVCLAVAASGCATMHYPAAYKVEGKEVKKFEELDDDRALKLIALIYNVKYETWEDGIARSIALEEYLGLLAKRRSQYVKKSDIFGIKYDKVKLSSWENEDLVKLYDALIPRADIYYMEAAPELTEAQNARRIVYLTAINVVAKELKKRNNARSAISVVSRILIGVLTVAISLI